MPSSTMTSASDTLAHVTPIAPSSIWRRAIAGDLWALECGRQSTPRARRNVEILRGVALEAVEVEEQRRRVELVLREPDELGLAGGLAAGPTNGSRNGSRRAFRWPRPRHRPCRSTLLPRVLPLLRSPRSRRIVRSRPRARSAGGVRSAGAGSHSEGSPVVKVSAAVAEMLKREGVEFLIGYPVNQIIESAAEVDIRTIIVRQERTGLHMADAVSRASRRAEDRRLRDADRAGHRERVRRRRPGLRRLGADRRVPRRLRPRRRVRCRPTSTRCVNYQHDHQVDRAGEPAVRDARPRSGARSRRSGTAGRARSSSRSRGT